MLRTNAVTNTYVGFLRLDYFLLLNANIYKKENKPIIFLFIYIFICKISSVKKNNINLVNFGLNGCQREWLVRPLRASSVVGAKDAPCTSLISWYQDKRYKGTPNTRIFQPLVYNTTQMRFLPCFLGPIF